MRRDSPLKQLNTAVARGGPLGVEELANVGVSASLATYYVNSGWLERLGRGTFAFPSDELDLYKCLAHLQARWPSIHLGGASALRARELPTRWVKPAGRGGAPMQIWGRESVRLPEWFLDRFPSQYIQRAALNREQADLGRSLLEVHGAVVLASEPERAILEELVLYGADWDLRERNEFLDAVDREVPVRVELMASLIAGCPRKGIQALASRLLVDG